MDENAVKQRVIDWLKFTKNWPSIFYGEVRFDLIFPPKEGQPYWLIYTKNPRGGKFMVTDNEVKIAP